MCTGTRAEFRRIKSETIPISRAAKRRWRNSDGFVGALPEQGHHALFCSHCYHSYGGAWLPTGGIKGGHVLTFTTPLHPFLPPSRRGAMGATVRRRRAAGKTSFRDVCSASVLIVSSPICYCYCPPWTFSKLKTWNCSAVYDDNFRFSIFKGSVCHK